MLHNCLCCWGSSHQHFILCKLYINSFIVLLYKLRFAALRDACLWDPKCNFLASSTITFLQCCSTLHFLHHFPFSGISCWKPSNRARSTETKSCRHPMTKKLSSIEWLHYDSVIIHCDFGESSPRSLFEGLPGLFYRDGNHEYTFQYGVKTPADCWRCDFYCIRLIKIWHL